MLSVFKLGFVVMSYPQASWSCCFAEGVFVETIILGSHFEAIL